MTVRGLPPAGEHAMVLDTVTGRLVLYERRSPAALCTRMRARAAAQVETSCLDGVTETERSVRGGEHTCQATRPTLLAQNRSIPLQHQVVTVERMPQRSYEDACG